MSLSCFDTPKIINCSYFAFFKCCNLKEFDRIRQNHASDLKKEKNIVYFNLAKMNHGF